MGALADLLNTAVDKQVYEYMLENGLWERAKLDGGR